MRFQSKMLFTLFAVAVFTYVAFAARNWPLGARLFPWAIGIPMAVLSLVQLGVELYRSGRRTDHEEISYTADLQVDWDVDTSVVLRNAASFFCWLLGLVLGVWLIGFFLSVPLFTILYLKFQAQERWLLSLILTAATFAFLVGLFELILHVPWPQPLLPWPEAILKALLPWVE